MLIIVFTRKNIFNLNNLIFAEGTKEQYLFFSWELTFFAESGNIYKSKQKKRI